MLSFIYLPDDSPVNVFFYICIATTKAFSLPSTWYPSDKKNYKINKNIAGI